MRNNIHLKPGFLSTFFLTNLLFASILSAKTTEERSKENKIDLVENTFSENMCTPELASLAYNLGLEEVCLTKENFEDAIYQNPISSVHWFETLAHYVNDNFIKPFFSGRLTQKIEPKIIPEGEENPLAKVMSEEITYSLRTMEALLIQGYKLRSEDLPQAFDNSRNLGKKISLLEKYEALPGDICIPIPTLKFHDMFLNPFDETKNKILDTHRRNFPNDDPLTELKNTLYDYGYDLDQINPNGFSDWYSPIKVMAANGNTKWVRYLMQMGVKEQPLFFLFLQLRYKYFYLYPFDPLKIENEFKNNLKNLLEKDNGGCLEQYEIAKIFIQNPNQNLLELLNRLEGSKVDPKSLLPFFSLAARKNDIDLFNSNIFRRLLLIESTSAYLSLKVAAAFNSIEYIEETIDVLSNNPIDDMKPFIKSMINSASATFNDELLKRLINKLETSYHLELKDILHHDYDPLFSGFDDECEPLAIAIIVKNSNAVKFLLEHGLFQNEHYNEDVFASYLHLAITGSNIDIVKLLLDHDHDGKALNHEAPYSGASQLHEAIHAKKWDIAKLLYQYKANTNAKDNYGKTPLDYIDDPSIKKELLTPPKTNNEGILNTQSNLFSKRKGGVLKDKQQPEKSKNLQKRL